MKNNKNKGYQTDANEKNSNSCKPGDKTCKPSWEKNTQLKQGNAGNNQHKVHENKFSKYFPESSAMSKSSKPDKMCNDDTCCKPCGDNCKPRKQ